MPKPFSELAGAFHDAWADGLPDPLVRFSNYGYQDPAGPGTDWFRPADESHRLHLNLIHHLLLDVDCSGKVILEVSSGRGGNCQYIEDYTEAVRVLGVDRCIGGVRMSCERLGPEGPDFVAGDAECLPLAHGCVDVVVSLEAAHCYGRFDRFLAEVDRVLHAGGLFCFADLWDLGLPGVDWGEREAQLGDMGYELVRHEDISQGVRRALEAENEGIFRFLDRATAGQGTLLADRVAFLARELRTQLAAGLVRYRLWHLRKPKEPV